MLVVQSVAADVDNSHHGNLELFATGRHARQEPVDDPVVCAVVHKFLDNAVRSDGAGHDDEFGVRRVAERQLCREMK